MTTVNAQQTYGLDLIDQIMRFESGEMEQDEVIEFFQSLVNTGLAWTLQGSYGRTAHNLLKAGYIHPKANA